MRTNASVSTITRALEIVSEKQFGGNLIFRTRPHHITANVVKFTLRTKDKNKPGSYVDQKTKRKQPKASQEAYLKVLEQAFKLEPIKELYGDFPGGSRIYNENWKEHALKLAKETKKAVITSLSDRKQAAKFPAIPRATGPQKETSRSRNVAEFVSSLKYIIENKDLLSDPSVLAKI